MKQPSREDLELDADRAEAQRLARVRSPEQQRLARAEFARHAAHSEFGAARRRRS